MKSILRIAICLLIISIHLSAQGTWTQNGNFPGNVRTDGTAFTIGSKIYFGLGYYYSGNTVFNDWWEYTPATDTWIQKNNFPGAARGQAISFTIGNKGYVGLGGFPGTANYNDFYEYDPTTDQWTKKDSILGNVFVNYCSGFSIGTKGYVFGGASGAGNYSRALHQYDSVADTWTQKLSYTDTSRMRASSFVLGNYAYVGLGTNNNQGQQYSDFYRYSATTGAWTSVAPMPSGGRYGAWACSLSGYAYCGGGYVSSYANDYYRYDSTANTWTHLTVTAPELYATATATYNGKCYFFCGGNHIGNLNTVWVYDPAFATEVNELTKESSIHVFPNPVSDKLSIELSGQPAATISIFSLLGEKILEQPFASNIDVSSLPCGIYILKTSNKEGQPLSYTRFVKQ